MHRLLLAVLVLALLLPSAAHAVTPRTFEQRTIYQVNRHRVHDVKSGRCADHRAERWVRHLHRLGDVLVHSDMERLARRCNANLAGEVIALGGANPRATVRAWLHSPEHRAVIRNRRYDRIGVGAIKVSGGWLVVADLLAK